MAHRAEIPALDNCNSRQGRGDPAIKRPYNNQRRSRTGYSLPVVFERIHDRAKVYARLHGIQRGAV
jgi:hypothetical protein